MKKIEECIDNSVLFNNNKFSLIIGLSPSEGARSPKLWNKAYKKLKINAKMFPADVKFKKLKKLVYNLKNCTNFIGGSVTIPYKSKIIKYIDHIDQKSKTIGSINTIKKIGNKLYGTNTDYYGCYNSLKKIKLKSKDNIIILGCGGAGKSCIIATLDVFKKNKIFLFNRNYSNANNFIKKNIFKKISILKSYEDMKKLKNIKLIINTTSVGFDSWQRNKKLYFNLKFFSPLSNINKMIKIKRKDNISFLEKNYKIIKTNKSETDMFLLKNKPQIFDIIYNPSKTALILYGIYFKCKVKNGLQMNLDQAIKGFMFANKISNFNLIKKVMS